MSSVEACQKNGIAPEEFERWRKCFMDGGRQAFETPDVLRDLHARIGTQAMEIETLKKQLASHNGTNGVAKPS